MKRKMIAVTGFIGSGKSTVMQILRQMGRQTANCDDIARKISQQPKTVATAEKILGGDCVSDGQLNRKLVRERIFADEQLLKSYQSLFFEEVRAELLRLSQGEGALYVEIAVMDAFDFPWDEVWRVDCERAEISRRVTLRDGVTEQSVAATLSKQKAFLRPTRIISNNGTLSDLEQAVLGAVNAAETV